MSETSEVRDNTHSTGYSVSYTYDHNQNRLTKTLNSVTDTYSYDAQNKLTGITGSVTSKRSAVEIAFINSCLV